MEYRSPVCKARICRKSPLMFQHPSFILARRNNRHHFRVSSRVMPMPPGYIKVFGFAPTWCTKECLTRKCRAFFCCSILKKARSGAASGILEQGGGTQCRKERHSAAFLSPRALYFLRTVCYGITVQVSDNSTTNLASVAAMASWSLFSKFVFCSILMTWNFTVDGSMPSSFAISL